MKALVLSAMLTFAFIAVAQVEVTVPKSGFRQRERIEVRVANKTSSPISICVEFGQTSIPDDGSDRVEATPTPVYVQTKHGNNWSTLMYGPDIGSSRHSVTLDKGEAQTYPIRIPDKGQMRVVLRYWTGEVEYACERMSGEKIVYSRPFRVE